jgi:hypothetical protein
VGPVSHQWLDGAKSIIGCRKLNEWNPKSSSLLEITEDIIGVLLASKGKATSDANATLSPAPSPSTNTRTTSHSQAQGYSLGNFPGDGTTSINNHSYAKLRSYGAQLSVASQPYSFPNISPQPSSYPNLNVAPQSSSNPQLINSSATSSGTAIHIPTQQQSNLTIAPPVPPRRTLQRNDSSNSPMQMALPDIPTHFPELDNLTEVQLERLLKESIAMDAHIAAMDSVHAMESLRDMQRETNSQFASNNLILGEEVKEMFGQAESLQVQIRSLFAELNQVTQEVHRDGTLAREKLLAELRKLVSTLDDESDAIGEGLIRGTVDLPTFKRDYLEKRSKFYTLACRVELAASVAATAVPMSSTINVPKASVQYASLTNCNLGGMYR